MSASAKGITIPLVPPFFGSLSVGRRRRSIGWSRFRSLLGISCSDLPPWRWVQIKIYFVGGSPKPTELWILDPRSGKLRQGPNMRETRFWTVNSVGVADGKLYVIQELENGSIQEEILDLESQTWEVAGVPVPDERVDYKLMVESSVTLDGKVYAMDYGRITVYNLRQGRRKEKLEMPVDCVWHMCVADHLLFALFTNRRLTWLDTRRNVWRVVSGDVQKTLPRILYGCTMAEYYGKLAVFWRQEHMDTGTNKKQEQVWCALIALARVGEEDVCGTIEWSGVVATIPYLCRFLHCVVASD